MYEAVPFGELLNVRFGSEAVIRPNQPDVRFAPIADIRLKRLARVATNKYGARRRRVCSCDGKVA